jgi:hypothetical protein
LTAASKHGVSLYSAADVRTEQAPVTDCRALAASVTIVDWSKPVMGRWHPYFGIAHSGDILAAGDYLGGRYGIF